MAILDHLGRPMKRGRQPRGIDLFFQLPQVEALSEWDSPTAKAHAFSHSQGQFTVSARLYYAMLTDPRVSDGLEKRALAGRNVPVEVVPGDGPGAEEVADRFRRRFGLLDDGRRGPNRIVAPKTQAELHGQALMLGVAPIQPEWEYDDKWFYPQVKPWHPQLCYYLPLAWANQTSGAFPGKIYTYSWGSASGEAGVQIPIEPGTGQWMLFALSGDQKPWLHGKLGSCWRAWISRLMAMLQWLRFNDVHGLPIRLVKSPMGMRTEPEMQKFYANVKQIGRDATLLAPQLTDGKVGVGVDLIEAKSESWRSFEAMLNGYGREITVDLTGGTQNAEAVGGNYKGAEEQREIRHEVKAADCESWSECLNEQLCVPFAVLNGYPREAAPRVVYDTAPPRNRADDAKAAAEEFKAMQEAGKAAEILEARGVKISVEEILKDRGISLGRARQAARG